MISYDVLAKAEMWDIFMDVARKMLDLKRDRYYLDNIISVRLDALSDIDGNLTNIEYSTPCDGLLIKSDNLEEVYIKTLLHKLDLLEKQK